MALAKARMEPRARPRLTRSSPLGRWPRHGLDARHAIIARPRAVLLTEARWEGQRFPAAEVDRHAPSTGAPNRELRVRNGAQQLFAVVRHENKAIDTHAHLTEASIRQEADAVEQLLASAKWPTERWLPLRTASLKTRSRTFRTEQVAVPGHSAHWEPRWPSSTAEGDTLRSRSYSCRGGRGGAVGQWLCGEDQRISEMLRGSEQPTAQGHFGPARM
ncbi:hypothetical protein T492DRAFT_835395 [Pavlovales sp. CCMP2436]|nr:hypothetical protein T492DRAFT_835395 [Pavlovales sp. CCMP2436]